MKQFINIFGVTSILEQHLQRKGKRYQKRHKIYARCGHIKNRVSIDERSAIVE